MSAARAIHVGTPPSNFPLNETVEINFHNFASLSIERGVAVYSPKFTCSGFDWRLKIYPGGTEDSISGMIGVFLTNKSPSKIRAGYDVKLKKRDGSDYETFVAEDDVFDANPKRGRCRSWGWASFANLGNLLDPSKAILNNGALTFEVCIRPHRDYYCHISKPPCSLNKDIYKLFGNEESADVAFNVGSRVFHAHKLILKARTPEFAELVEQFTNESGMPIKDVKPEVFEAMLKHVYGKNILPDEWCTYSKQILEASGKYGFSFLKLEAEAWHMKNFKLTVESVIDELLYADGKDCPLMKKAAMEFIVQNGQEVLVSPTYARLAESPELMKEVMMEFAKSTESRKRKLESR